MRRLRAPVKPNWKRLGEVLERTHWLHMGKLVSGREEIARSVRSVYARRLEQLPPEEAEAAYQIALTAYLQARHNRRSRYP